MNSPLSSDQLVSSKLATLEAARRQCEEGARTIVNRIGGHWEWIDSRRLRVYVNDKPFATLHVETVQ